jgi:hypothetical protein
MTATIHDEFLDPLNMAFFMAPPPRRVESRKDALLLA